MKTRNDPRHKKRKKTVQELFALSFHPQQQTSPNTKQILEGTEKIDGLIEKNAPEWPIEKLNKTDLAILRLAVFELAVEKQEPYKVIIDEAIELAKELGGENSPAFINGVLGSIVRDLKLEGKT